MKLLYKPFALVAGVIGAKLGQSAFKAIWSKLDEAEPPEATSEEASLPKVVGAKALEAATVAGVAAAVNRARARSFHYLFGIWPGEKDRPHEG
jgi:predicted DNA-binding transcriptional regulator YafY